MLLHLVDYPSANAGPHHPRSAVVLLGVGFVESAGASHSMPRGNVFIKADEAQRIYRGTSGRGASFSNSSRAGPADCTSASSFFDDTSPKLSILESLGSASHLGIGILLELQNVKKHL